MITTAVGKMFLEAYNAKYKTSYSAEQFFDEVLFPLFFDSNKYFMWVTNSPFVQMKKGQKVETLTHEERLQKLSDLHTKIDEGVKDYSVAPGYAASEEKEYSTTSGQVSNDFDVSPEDKYLAWIGSSLGIGVNGGLSILFFNRQILMDLFEGWKIYRDILDNTPSLKGNQLSSWNGQWLIHRYSKRYIPSKPMADFTPFQTSGDKLSIGTGSWTKLLIEISMKFEDPQMTGYVYSFSKVNTTVGFIGFSLSQIRKPIEFYINVFGSKDKTSVEEIWDTETGLLSSCQTGAIGLKALRPEGMKAFMDSSVIPEKAKNKDIQIKYNTYIIWILAMLDNQQLMGKSKDFAKVLLDFSKASKNGKTGNSQKVMNVLSAKDKKSFISALTDILSCTQKDKVIEMAEIVNAMPTDNVPYFTTLLRFSYTAIS